MSLLSKLLQKRGIKDKEDLSPDEKEVFSRYELVMKGGEVTVETLLKYVDSQIKIIENKFASGDNTDKKDAYYRAALHIYLNLRRAITAPEIERASLEQYLTSLINES